MIQVNSFGTLLGVQKKERKKNKQTEKGKTEELEISKNKSAIDQN